MRTARKLPILLLLVLSACSRNSYVPPAGSERDTLVVACREPTALDPAYMVGRNDVGVTVNLLTGLFRPAPDGGQPRPGLATSWSCDDKGTGCTFHLDPEARWSDGEPVTAADLDWSWRRIAAAETGSPGAETMHIIRGMAACTSGSDCTPAIEVIDPYTLKVELEEPQPMLPYIMAHPRWYPVPRHVVKRHGDAWASPEHFVGNGDYRPIAWRRGVSMTLERTRGSEEGPARVELRFTVSEDTALRWFEAGEVDVVDGLVPLDRVPNLRRERPDVVRIAAAASVFYLAPNHRRAPFDQVGVRRALSKALDRELLVGTVLGTGQKPATSIVPGVVAAISGYRAPAECKGRNLDEAREALAGAGYPAGKGLAPAELVYNQSSTMNRLMTFVQQDLEGALGLRTSLRSMEWTAFLETVRTGDFQVARFGLTGEPDPMDFLGALTSDAANNIGGFSSARYDRLVAAARRTGDPDKRNSLLAQAETILCQEAAVIPIYHSVTVVLARPGVRGYEANHSGLHPLRDVDIGN